MIKLIIEAARDQRRNPRLSWPLIAVSVLWRTGSSAMFKLVTWIDLLRQRANPRIA